MNADDQNSLKRRLEIGKRLEALGRQAQPLARIVDQAPRDSSQWTEPAKELCAITAECLYRSTTASGENALLPTISSLAIGCHSKLITVGDSELVQGGITV